MTRYQFLKSKVGTKKAFAIIHSLKSQGVHLTYSDNEHNYLLAADFPWEYTTQGFDFWCELSAK